MFGNVTNGKSRAVNNILAKLIRARFTFALINNFVDGHDRLAERMWEIDGLREYSRCKLFIQ